MAAVTGIPAWVSLMLGSGMLAYAYHLSEQDKKGSRMPTDTRISIHVDDRHHFRVVVAVPRTIQRIAAQWRERVGPDTSKAPKPLPHIAPSISDEDEDLARAVEKALVRFATDCLRLPNESAADLNLTEAQTTIARLEDELKTARALVDEQRKVIVEKVENERLGDAYLATNRSILADVKSRLVYLYRRIGNKRGGLRSQSVALREEIQLALDRIEQDSK